jgi:phosphatidylserine/phosphatidylglycerophosphate/cardiolipin synthase-like enzyme
VKLIASEWQSKSWLEKLQDAGLDAANYVKIQPKVHNKGIVVDSSIVVVSSQNWSADGTGENRDAGLIIYDPDAAKYFEAIFVHDWENMAAKRAYGS